LSSGNGGAGFGQASRTAVVASAIAVGRMFLRDISLCPAGNEPATA
jgi:hypothetical protein